MGPSDPAYIALYRVFLKLWFLYLENKGFLVANPGASRINRIIPLHQPRAAFERAGRTIHAGIAAVEIMIGRAIGAGRFPGLDETLVGNINVNAHRHP